MPGSFREILIKFVLPCGREHAFKKHFCFWVWLVLYSTQRQNILEYLKWKTLCLNFIIFALRELSQHIPKRVLTLSCNTRFEKPLPAHGHFGPRTLLLLTQLSVSNTSVHFQRSFFPPKDIFHCFFPMLHCKNLLFFHVSYFFLLFTLLFIFLKIHNKNNSQVMFIRF